MKKKYFGFVLMLFFTASINSYAQGSYLDCSPAGSLVETSGTVSELNGTSAFTFEAKVRIGSIGAVFNIMNKLVSSTDRVALQINPTGLVTCCVSNGNGAFRNSATALQLNTWYHIAMVYNGALAGNAKLALYIDGVSQTLGGSALALPTTTSSNAATFKVAGGGYLKNIDEVRVWDAALSQPTIDAWKGTDLNNTHPNNANLKLYWNFNDLVNTPLVENGTLATTYDGTIANALYVNSTLGIRDLENRPAPIFSNPFNSELSVTLNLAENADVLLSLYDLEGKIIKEISKKNDAAGTNVYTMPTESISKGLYLLKIMTNGKVQTYKVIKN